MRTVSLLQLNVFGNAELKASDIPNGTRIRFLRIDYGTGRKEEIPSRGLLMLLSKYPYENVDKVKDRVVDVGELIGDTPDYFIYRDGELFLDAAKVEKTYPDIARVIFRPAPPPPSPTVTPTFTPTITPSLSVSGTPGATPTPSPTHSVSPTPAALSPTPTPTVTPTTGAVGIVSAGEDMTSLCANTVPLVGSIVGGGVIDPTILWEQIDGPAVIIDNPNILVTFYNYSATADRTFRLWVNKDLPNQAYADVTIFGTPSTNVGTVIASTFPQGGSLFVMQPLIILEDFTGD